MNRLVPQYTDGMVIVLGGLVNPLAFVQLVYGIGQIPFHHTRSLSHASYHIFQNLSGSDHHKIIFLARN